jgi:hypothetical protein
VGSCLTIASRDWDSGHGTDQARRGPVPTTYRTPQYAHNNIVAAEKIIRARIKF